MVRARLNVCWSAVTGYFLISGEDNCPRMQWIYFTGQEHCMEVELNEQAERMSEHCMSLKFTEITMHVSPDAVLSGEGA